MKELWRVELQNEETLERWTEDVLATSPLAQASAEVTAIKSAGERGIKARCTFSRFVEERP